MSDPYSIDLPIQRLDFRQLYADEVKKTWQLERENEKLKDNKMKRDLYYEATGADFQVETISDELLREMLFDTNTLMENLKKEAVRRYTFNIKVER